jgi:hypothetical protein
MRLAPSQISTNYGTAHDDGSVTIFVYRAGGIKELKIGNAHGEMKTDYRGNLFVVADGSCALHALQMWLYYNLNNGSHACDIDGTWHEGGNVYKVTPRDGAEPYELSSRVGTILGVKDGLPFEVEFK